ncbi:hypothetical protein A3F37_01595 [Candidatus Saccharibacteria bacterium RIFCSPHIGHO2_12_FULL_41_12]|nr:MAG: hypothetical protein A3F37_01595 [Candidatus Saccharibacteria bacterium RIFCSPHIGHO2_12_FULL_41_12]
MLLAWVMSPWVVLAIMTLWEPIEIFVISPILAKYGIGFGYEGPLNSFSDILFNIVGILIGYYLLREIATPPFYLFN